jgi:hypothetical protein
MKREKQHSIWRREREKIGRKEEMCGPSNGNKLDPQELNQIRLGFKNRLKGELKFGMRHT